MTKTKQSSARRRRAEIRALQDIGALFYGRCWSLATSSNYSVVLSRKPLRLLITASGRDKRRLADDDFVIVDEAGRAVEPAGAKPSAETPLHVAAAKQPHVGSVLHTHSVWGTLLSELFFNDGGVVLEGYEMIKGLAGQKSHLNSLRVEIFENTQDIPGLARRVQARWNGSGNPLRYGFLIRGHGLYTWGRDLNEARRHVEVFEFLFEVLGRRLSLPVSMENGK